jgi:hypothetical protein
MYSVCPAVLSAAGETSSETRVRFIESDRVLTVSLLFIYFIYLFYLFILFILFIYLFYLFVSEVQSLLLYS